MEKEERELEGEERGTREERENERLGWESPVFIFDANSGTLEHKGHRLSVTGFQILPLAILGAHWSARGYARACLHARV